MVMDKLKFRTDAIFHKDVIEKVNNLIDEISNINGAGEEPNGWVQISDNTRDSSNPLSLAANVRTKVNVSADSVIESYAPPNTTASTFYNETLGKLYGESEGDSYILRITYKADPSQNNTNIAWSLDIGGSQGSIFDDSTTLVRGANEAPYSQIIPYYTLGTFQANGGELYVTASHNCDIYDVRLYISRISRGA